MVRRVFWVALGASAGVIAARRLRRLADAATPQAIGGAMVAAARGFLVEVRSGMAEREAELRTALGLDGGVGR